MHIEAFIAKLPKVELNVHLEGCLTPDLIFKFAKRNHITLPYATVDDLRTAYQFKSVESFLALYEELLVVLQTEEDFYELTLDYLLHAANQTIRHAEISFDPQAHLRRGIKFETMINGMKKAIDEAKEKHHISAYPIMCFMRELGEAEAEKVFEMALPYKDLIVAVGLDSNEIGNPPDKFENVFAAARSQGFLTVVIAGEMGPPEYIWQALDVLRVSRIDHGIRAIDDPDLMAKLSASQVPLNLCPISNIKLGIYPNLKVYPLKKMHDEGIVVTINSDDPAYLQADLNQNYIAVHSALRLNKMLIAELAKNSVTASFLDYDRQEQLIREIDKFLVESSREE